MTNQVTITSEDKKGSKFWVKLSDIDAIRSKIEWPLSVTGCGTIVCSNKSERHLLDSIIWSLNNAQATKKSAKQEAVKSGRKNRYIELLDVAEDKNLKHGASWVCSAYNVDSQSLNPAWEGELICYVYVS